MESQATIFLTLADVELVDSKAEGAPKGARLASLRIFTLSVILGLTIGAVFSVIEPIKSKDLSLRIRAHAQMYAHDVAARVSDAIARERR